MKFPEWLPELNQPTRAKRGATEWLIQRLTEPFAQIFKIEAAGGMVLLACTVLVLVLANTPWAAPFAGIWQTRAGISCGGFDLQKPLLLWP